MDSPFRWRMAHVWGCPDIDTHDGPTQQPTTIRPMHRYRKKWRAEALFLNCDLMTSSFHLKTHVLQTIR